MAIALAPWLLASAFQEVASLSGVVLPGMGSGHDRTPDGAAARTVLIVYGGAFLGLRLGGPVAALVFTLRWIVRRIRAARAPTAG